MQHRLTDLFWKLSADVIKSRGRSRSGTLRGSREGWARGFTRRLRKESEKFSEACTAELFMA